MNIIESCNEDARAARDEAMSQVEHNAGEEWNDYADRVIAYAVNKRKANGFDTITTDHVIPLLKVMPHEMRAIGPAMMRAKRNGFIEATSHFTECKRVSRHAAPLRVWKILRGAF